MEKSTCVMGCMKGFSTCFLGRRERERDKMTLRTLDGLPGVPFLAHVQRTGFNDSILWDWVRGKYKKNPFYRWKPSSLDHIASKQHRVYPVKAWWSLQTWRRNMGKKRNVYSMKQRNLNAYEWTCRVYNSEAGSCFSSSEMCLRPFFSQLPPILPVTIVTFVVGQWQEHHVVKHRTPTTMFWRPFCKTGGSQKKRSP